MTGERSAGVAIGIWAATVLVGAVLGWVGGHAMGIVLDRLSYDYVVVAEESVLWGVRTGLLAGTLIAAAQSFGPRPLAHPGRALVSVAMVVLLSAAASALGALVLHLAFRPGEWPFGHWQLPNPSRHALLVGVVAGRDLGAAVGVVAALALVARSRGLSIKRLLWVACGCAVAWVALAWARPPLATLLGAAPGAALQAAFVSVNGAVARAG
jgi:hypothetical protein